MYQDKVFLTKANGFCNSLSFLSLKVLTEHKQNSTQNFTDCWFQSYHSSSVFSKGKGIVERYFILFTGNRHNVFHWKILAYTLSDVTPTLKAHFPFGVFKELVSKFYRCWLQSRIQLLWECVSWKWQGGFTHDSSTTWLPK